MPYPVNPLVAAVTPPPIAESAAWVQGRQFPPDKPLLDLAQAVPKDPPPPELLAHLQAAALKPESYRYTAILGQARVREVLAAQVSALYGAAVAPEQVAITAGCNQAYCLAISALAQAGDEVILPLPHYFNHEMLLAQQGIRAVPLRFREESGGVPDPEEARRRIGPRTRAIVLVSPNNPTGAVLPQEVLSTFYELAREHGIALVLDETYRDFLPGGAAPHALFQRPDWPETLVHLYSFSKVYNLPGMRVGALIAAPRLLAQVAKVADCWMISAPTLSQEAAWFAMTHLTVWRTRNREVYLERGAALTAALRARPSAYRLVSLGAYFAYMRHPHGERSAQQAARHLAETQNVLCLPGSVFGPQQEPYLRLAFANLDAADMPALTARLAADAVI